MCSLDAGGDLRRNHVMSEEPSSPSQGTLNESKTTRPGSPPALFEDPPRPVSSPPPERQTLPRRKTQEMRRQFLCVTLISHTLTSSLAVVIHTGVCMCAAGHLLACKPVFLAVAVTTGELSDPICMLVARPPPASVRIFSVIQTQTHLLLLNKVSCQETFGVVIIIWS